MITIKDQHLLCTNCGCVFALSMSVVNNCRKSDAFTILHEDCQELIPDNPTLDLILKSITRVCDVSIGAIRGNSQTYKTCNARRVLVSMMRMHLELSMTDIAAFMGYFYANGVPNHTIVINYIKTDSIKYANDNIYRKLKDEVGIDYMSNFHNGLKQNDN